MSELIKRESNLSQVTPEHDNTFLRVVKEGKSRLSKYPLHILTTSIPAKTETQIVHNKELFALEAYYVGDNGYLQKLMVRNEADNKSVYLYSSTDITNKTIIIKFI